MLRLFRLMRLRQSGHGKPKAQCDGNGQHEINQAAQQRYESHQPYALRAGKQHIGQQPVAYDNDQNNADDGLGNFRPGPILVTKNQIANEKGDRGGKKLRQYRHRQTGALAGAQQRRFNQLFKGRNVLLKFAAKKLAALGIQPVNIRHQYQQSAENEHHQINGNQRHGRLLRREVRGLPLRAFSSTRPFRWTRAFPAGAVFAGGESVRRSAESVRSIKDAGSLRRVRNRASSRAICPRSASWSWPDRCNMPWRTKIFNSAVSGWPYRKALAWAISAEIAMSPPSARGKESTSVGLFLRRNRRLSSLSL